MNNQNKGSVLTIAVLTTVIVGLLASGLFVLSLRSADQVSRQRYSMQAFFLAEAGANQMIAILKDDFDAKDDPSQYPSGSLGEGTYEVNILQPSGRVVVVGRGIVKGIEREVLIEVGMVNVDPFDFGVMANDDANIYGDSTVIANLRTNDDLILNEQGALTGNAASTGNITVLGSGNISGSQTEGVISVNYPTFDFNEYYNMAQDDGLYYSGNKIFNNANLAPGNGVIYVNGDVTIKGTTSITGGVIATGKIIVKNNFTQTQYGNIPALMSRDQRIEIRDNSSMNGLIYTASDKIKFRGTGTLNGQVISFGKTEFTTSSNMTLNYVKQTPPGLILTETSVFSRLTYYE